MSIFDTDDLRFPNSYDRESGWIKVLPIQDRALQAQEFNEIQTLALSNLKAGFDNLFRPGSILRGLRGRITSLTSSTVDISFTPGEIYLDGLVIQVAASSFTLDANLIHNFGVEINTAILEETNEPDLRDPDTRGARYGLPGAARLVIQSQITVNQPNTYAIARYADSQLVNKIVTLPLAGAEDLLNRYTQERAGKFVANGLEVSNVNPTAQPVDSQSFLLAQQNLEQTEQEFQTLLAEVTEARTGVTELETSLQTAQESEALSPTLDNQNLTADLTVRLAEQQALFERLSSRLADLNGLLEIRQADVQQLELALQERILLLVSPGRAFVNRWVTLENPVTLSIPKELGEATVEDATFTYGGTRASTRRLILQLQDTWQDAVDEGLTLRIVIDNLVIEEAPRTLVLDVSVGQQDATSIDEFILRVQDIFNSEQFFSGVTFSSPDLDLNSQELRRELKRQLVISANGSALRFESLNVGQSGNEINVNTQFFIGSTTTPATTLGFDITDAFLSGGSVTSQYQLGFRPVSEILSLNADLEASLEPIARGIAPGTEDRLADDSVTRITRVTDGERDYILGTDFQLLRQSVIDWSLAGNEPTPGSTYYVSYEFTQGLIQNEDYILNRATDTLEFIGRQPARGQEFRVTYSYTLSQAGVLTITNEGNLDFLLSDSGANPLPPPVPNEQLGLATFRLFADQVTVEQTQVRPLPYASIREIINQNAAARRNVELLSLETRALEDSSLRIGALPTNATAWNFTSAGDLALDNPQFTAVISPATNSLSTGFRYIDLPLEIPAGGRIHPGPQGQANHLLTLTYTSTTAFEQRRATQSISLPSPEVTKPRGVMALSPQQLYRNELDDTVLTPCDPLVSITSLLQRIGNGRPRIIADAARLVRDNFTRVLQEIEQSQQCGNALGQFFTDPEDLLSRLINTVTARNERISVRVTNVPPATESWRIYISGQQVLNFSALFGTPLSGVTPNALRSTTAGELNFSFQLPNGLPCGNHLVEVISPSGYAATRLAVFNTLLNQIVIGTLRNWERLFPNRIDTFAPFQGEAILGRINQQPLPGIPFIPDRPRNIFPFEGLSETFEVPEAIFITSAWVKVRSADSAGDLSLVLRGAQNSTPGSSVYAIAPVSLLQPDQNASLYSQFDLPYPVLLSPERFYTLGVQGKGAAWELWEATLGEADVVDNSVVGEQLLVRGDLWRSEDGINLERLENRDLSYLIRRAQFQTTPTTISLGTYEIQESINGINIFSLNIRDIIPAHTEIKYEYRTSGQGWIEFNANEPICLASRTASVRLRATLSSDSDLVSPALILDGASVSLYDNLTSARSYSQTISQPTTYQNVTLLVVQREDTPITYAAYFSSQSFPRTWNRLDLDTSYRRVVDAGLSLIERRYTWTSSVPVGPDFTWRLDLFTSNSTNLPLVNTVVAYVS